MNRLLLGPRPDRTTPTGRYPIHGFDAASLSFAFRKVETSLKNTTDPSRISSSPGASASPSTRIPLS